MRMKPWFARGTLFALTMWMSVLMAAPAVAQVDTGTLLGTVKDQSGAVLPGATVTITHEGQGITLTTVTRADGTFIFTPIRTGAYTVETEFPGFKKGVRRGIPVAIQEQAVVDFSLQPGGVAEEVVVTGESPLLQTGNGTVGETFKSGHAREHARQRPRLHDPGASGHRRRASAARRARAAHVRGQRCPAGAEQLPARRDRQQHEQRRLPERRRVYRQAADRRGRRDQDHDERLQRRVRARRRSRAQHHPQVWFESAARERRGSSLATTR